MQHLGQIDQHGLTRTRLLELVKRFWPIVLTTFLTGTVAMYLILQVFFTDIYESNARLLVKVGRENVETPPTVRNGQVFSQGVRSADITSEVQILSSQVLLERVVEKLGADRFKSVLVPPESWLGYPKYAAKYVARQVKQAYRETLIFLALEKRVTPGQEAVLRLVDGVKVEPIKDSDILVLKVRTPSPQLCIDVADSLLAAYLKDRTAIRRTPGGSEFFAARVQEASKQLEALQRTRATVRARWNISSPDEERSLYLKQLNGLQAELVQSGAELARLTQQKDSMQQRSQGMPEMMKKEQVVAPNPAILTVKDRLTALKVERAKLASRYLPDSEMLKKFDSEITDLESALASEQATIVNSVTTETNPTRREFQAGIELQSVQIAGIKGKTDFLRAPVAQLSNDVKNIDRGADEVAKVNREYHRAEENYLFYAKRLEEAQMSEVLDSQRVANVVVVETPETPILPVAPKKQFLLGIAMAVSLVLGIALSAFLETTDDRIMGERSILEMDDFAYLGTVELGGSR
ncbi:Wzz/FepE/Etk N-terminal domain-containing protein [uncultured Paludibaculum sp.]|uniref:GumC family protein n=1 Tax=uncultured Paludibaculum sp. TaxID=1765020 RepID=UPI002AAB02A2|nr:Wzz/FepE/Etk N-terminal domain-containing protein [uncultured Paludibaculum sp.]